MSRMLTENVTENFERMKEAFRMFDKVKSRYERCILLFIKIKNRFILILVK